MKIFIGSSSEAESQMNRVKEILKKLNMSIEIEDWKNDNVFKIGHIIYDDLMKKADEVDAAIFIFQADDYIINNRNQEKIDTCNPKAVRDNVVLEYGLFSGKLGIDRVMIAAKDNPKPTTDLDGVVYIDLEKDDEYILNRIKTWIFELDEDKEFKDTFTAKQMEIKYLKFLRECEKVYILVNDLDYLLNKDEQESQLDIIKNKKENANILCLKKDKENFSIEMIELIRELNKNKVGLFFYEKGKYEITNIKGQVRIDENGYVQSLIIDKITGKNNPKTLSAFKMFNVESMKLNKWFEKEIVKVCEQLNTKKNEEYIKYILRRNNSCYDGILVAFDGLNESTQSTMLEKINDKLKEEIVKVEIIKQVNELSMVEVDKQYFEVGNTDAMDCIIAGERYKNLELKIKPLLKKGYIVLCDTYIASSFISKEFHNDNYDFIYGLNSHLIQPDIQIFLYKSQSKTIDKVMDYFNKEKIYNYKFDISNNIEKVVSEICNLIFRYKAEKLLY